MYPTNSLAFSPKPMCSAPTLPAPAEALRWPGIGSYSSDDFSNPIEFGRYHADREGGSRTYRLEGKGEEVGWIHM